MVIIIIVLKKLKNTFKPGVWYTKRLGQLDIDTNIYDNLNHYTVFFNNVDL